MSSATVTVSRTRQVPLSAAMTTIQNSRVLVKSERPTDEGRRFADVAPRSGDDVVSLSKAHLPVPWPFTGSKTTFTNSTRSVDLSLNSN